MDFIKYLQPSRYISYLRYLRSKAPKVSYAQNGEDLIIDSALKNFHITNPSYLDIGTYHPVQSNNTYYFYKRGSRGVCIEPNPDLFDVIKRKRPHDVCLNVGIGPKDAKGAEYYVMTAKWLNTFKKEEADLYVAKGSQRIERVIAIPLVTMSSIMDTYFPGGLDVLSIDTEGYDLEIVKSFDFKKYRPKIICVETLLQDKNFSARFSNRKITEIRELVLAHGYFYYADTHINSIFVLDE